MWTVTPSPIGDLRIVARDGAITAIEFSPFRTPVSGQPLGTREDDDPLLRRAVDQLASYFAGDLTEFDLPLAPRGSTFQHAVWEQQPVEDVGASGADHHARDEAEVREVDPEHDHHRDDQHPQDETHGSHPGVPTP